VAKLTKTLANKSMPNFLTNMVSGIFNPQSPDVPAAQPLPDQEALDVARRRRLASTLQRSGRDSTIMSDALGS